MSARGGRGHRRWGFPKVIFGENLTVRYTLTLCWVLVALALEAAPGELSGWEMCFKWTAGGRHAVPEKGLDILIVMYF